MRCAPPGIPVVMGGPHVTEVPDEALGAMADRVMPTRSRWAKPIETWPRIVEDAARGQLKEVYAPVDAFGQERKPSSAGLSGDSVGIDRPAAVQPRSRRSVRPVMRHLRVHLGDVPHHPHRIRARLPLWLRVLHGHGILWRFDPLPHQPEHRRRDAASEGARARHARQGRRVLRGRQFRHQREAHQDRCCATSSRRAPNFRGWGRSAPTCCAMRNCST